MVPIKKRDSTFACHPIARPNNQTNGNKIYKKKYKQMNDKSERKIQLIKSINSNAAITIKLVGLADTNLELVFIRIYNILKVLDILNMEQTFQNLE